MVWLAKHRSWKADLSGLIGQTSAERHVALAYESATMTGDKCSFQIFCLTQLHVRTCVRIAAPTNERPHHSSVLPPSSGPN
jgi:hypothetical protein